MTPALVGLLPLLTARARERGATAAFVWRDALPSIQAGLSAHSSVAGATQPSLRTAADSWSHADPPVPTALGTDRLLAFGAGPAGGADALGRSVDSDAFSSVPASPVTRHFVTVSASKSRRTSALSRAKACSSVLTFGITVGILAGLSLVALGAEACAVADADASVVALRVALRLRVKHEADRDSPRCVRAPGGAQGDEGGQQHGRREAHDAHVVCKGERERPREGKAADGRFGPRRWRRK